MGSGGFGAVYLGIDEQGKLVAIKVPLTPFLISTPLLVQWHGVERGQVGGLRCTLAEAFPKHMVQYVQPDKAQIIIPEKLQSELGSGRVLVPTSSEGGYGPDWMVEGNLVCLAI